MTDSTQGETTIIPSTPGFWAAEADVPDSVAARAESAQDVADYLRNRLSPVVAWKVIDGPGGAVAYPVTPSGIKNDPGTVVFVVTPEGLVRGNVTNFHSLDDLASCHYHGIIGGPEGAAEIRERLNVQVSEIAMKTAIGKARDG